MGMLLELYFESRCLTEVSCSKSLSPYLDEYQFQVSCAGVFSGEKVAEKREKRKKKICIYTQSKSEERKRNVASGGCPWLGDQFEKRFQRLAASMRFVLIDTLQCVLKIREEI